METIRREQSGWSAALLNVQEIIMAAYKGGGGVQESGFQHVVITGLI